MLNYAGVLLKASRTKETERVKQDEMVCICMLLLLELEQEVTYYCPSYYCFLKKLLIIYHKSTLFFLINQ